MSMPVLRRRFIKLSLNSAVILTAANTLQPLHPAPDLVNLFANQKNLRTVFHGHDHDQDDVKENNGKFYFNDSHVAGSWGTKYNGYRIVEVLKNGEIHTYQMNPASEQKVNNQHIA